MPTLTGVFIHGLDSSSRGTKGTFFRQSYPQLLMTDYRGPLEERMTRLEGQLAGLEDLVLVGSSYGGLMATLFACKHETRVSRLILLAPALAHAPEQAFCRMPLAVPTTIYHGRHDDVVLPDETRRIAARLFGHLTFHLVDDDHNLHAVFPTLDWDRLLGMNEG
jgi:pimeloyl-ACP methyl ester carboxylesterase